MNPTRVAYGLWNGADVEVIRQAMDSGVRTFITSAAQGKGDADRALGEALQGRDRSEFCIIGGVESTDVVSESLERIGIEKFDVLMLSNPNRDGFRDAALWEALAGLKAAGQTDSLGIAPGPTNGYLLDLLYAFDHFGEHIDWAMVVLGALEAWPNEMCLDAAKAANVGIIARESTIPPGPAAPRMKGQRQAKVDKLAEIAESHSVSVEVLMSAWTLSLGVNSAAPLIATDRVAELGAVNDFQTSGPLSGEFAKVREIGDNRGKTQLKGGTQQFQGRIQPAQWPLDEELAATAEKHGIILDRDYLCQRDPRDHRDFGMPNRQGIPQATDERLFMQLQVFTGVRDPQAVVDEFRSRNAEAVVYEDLGDPFGIGVLLWNQDPSALNRTARELYRSSSLADATIRPEFTMTAKAYAFGREDPVHFWLNERPIAQATRPEMKWAVWYPLRRKPGFYRLPPQDQADMLREHGVIGHNYGAPGYASDIRLECFGLDANDNEFVLGLLSERLHWLSRLVKEMRGTQQTGEYMQSLGPFFVGEAIYQNGGEIAPAAAVGY